MYTDECDEDVHGYARSSAAAAGDEWGRDHLNYYISRLTCTRPSRGLNRNETANKGRSRGRGAIVVLGATGGRSAERVC